jgi:hypothetical protein
MLRGLQQGTAMLGQLVVIWKFTQAKMVSVLYDHAHITSRMSHG